MASRSIHVRLDEESDSALRLMRNQGMNDSEAVRTALREAGEKRRSREALREEVRRIAADPEYQAEVRAIQEDLDELSPPWPPE